MTGLTRFSIRTRLLVGFLAVLVLTGAAGAIALIRLAEVSSLTTLLVEQEVPEVHLLWTLRLLLVNWESQVLDLELDRSGRAQVGTQLRQLDRGVEAALAAYRAAHRILPSDEGPLLDELVSRYQTLRDQTERFVGLNEAGRDGESRARRLAEWRSSHAALMESLDRLRAFEEAHALGTAQVANARAVSARNLVAGLTLLSVLIGFLLAVGITRSIMNPITQLARATELAARGEPTPAISVAGRDEIGSLAERFEALLAARNRAAEEQRRFFADASHELRTPLTIIRGEAEVALRGPDKPTGEYKDALATILSVIGHVQRLAEDLLFVAMSSAGEVRYHMAATELGPLLETVQTGSRRLALIKGVRLELELHRRATVWGDPYRLAQLFLILVDNTIKYTPAGGEVRIVLEADPATAQVRVSDTGIGIAPQELPHIFERFYRGEPSERTAAEGTGLGLPIAKVIAEAHRGEIVVASEPGRGTTVTVRLPLNAPPAGMPVDARLAG